MAKPKVHYNPNVSYDEIVELNRVSHLCGAITTHGTPQPMVRETSNLDLVNCGNCVRRVNKML
jgi:hypothetical protein